MTFKNPISGQSTKHLDHVLKQLQFYKIKLVLGYTDVSGKVMLVTFSGVSSVIWCQNLLSTSETCHQHKPSPTSTTNKLKTSECTEISLNSVSYNISYKGRFITYNLNIQRKHPPNTMKLMSMCFGRLKKLVLGGASFAPL